MTAKRTDANQREVVAALRAVGAAVLDLHGVGRDCPDLLVARQGQTWLMEVKSAEGVLSEGQRKFMANWPGRVVVVRSVEEALRAVLLEE